MRIVYTQKITTNLSYISFFSQSPTYQHLENLVLSKSGGVPLPSRGGQDVPFASPGGVPGPSSGGGVPVASAIGKDVAVLPMPPRVVEPLSSPIFK